MNKSANGIGQLVMNNGLMNKGQTGTAGKEQIASKGSTVNIDGLSTIRG
ncbi:MAG TPA: hypothetical protein VFB43_04070 [Terracidiphilus sp.]|nr:hypothetical protein [Terracidiphilus sp.]